MPRSIDELDKELLRLKLVKFEDLAPARAALPPKASVSDYLEILERKQILTSLQVERIRKDEFDSLVIGGYKLLYRNSSGSFARFYRVESVETGQQIGMKVLRERWSNDPDTVKLFVREGELGKRLKNPNIVPIFEVGNDRKFYYITMEFVEGGNLKDFLAIRRKLAPGEACRFGHDIARGLEYGLRQGITHRDLKMTNVLMSSTGVAKLIDFGLAMEESVMKKVGGDAMAQALEYTTLETGSDAPRNDPRTDLYFLGTILYELLTGTAPYARTRDRDERKNFARYRDVKPIITVEPSLDWKAASIVDRLLQVNPAQRFQSATEVAEALGEVARILGEKLDVPASAQHSAPTASVGPAPHTNGAASKATIMCVEHRPKMQDVFRKFFSELGYRVLLLTDPDRALARVTSTPPDCLVLFGDQGSRTLEVFKDAAKLEKTAIVLVLGQNQVELAPSLLEGTSKTAILTQPIEFRYLRYAVKRLIARNNGRH